MMTSFPSPLKQGPRPHDFEGKPFGSKSFNLYDILATKKQDFDLSIFSSPDVQIRILGILRTRDFGALYLPYMEKNDFLVRLIL